MSLKFALALVRRLIASFIPSDSPGTVYAAHLALITQMTAPPPASSPGLPVNHNPAPLGAPALQATLIAIDNLINLARKNRHTSIVSLAHVIRLRVLLRAGAWPQVGAALQMAEVTLGLMFDNGKENNNGTVIEDGDVKIKDDILPRWNSITAGDVHTHTLGYSQILNSNSKDFGTKSKGEDTHSDPAHASLVIHTLLFGIIFFTFSGDICAAERRLIVLHALVDNGALQGFKDGIVQVH